MKHIWPIYLITTWVIVFIFNRKDGLNVGLVDVLGESIAYILVGLVGAALFSIKKKWSIAQWGNAITLGGLVVTSFVYIMQVTIVKDIIENN